MISEQITPLVSIIVPFYDVLPYFEECLSSISNQSYENIEVICVDDYSTDGSVLIARAFAKKDNRFKIISHPENKGLGGARNTGLESSSGEFLLFIDSDDVVAQDYVEKMVRTLQKENADLVFCGVTRFNDSERMPFSTFHLLKDVKDLTFPCQWNLSYLGILNIWPSACNKLFRRDIINITKAKFPEKILYEDHIFHYRYFSGVKKISYLQENLYFYRAKREGSITSALTGREKEIFTIISLIFKEFDMHIKNKEEREKAKKLIAFRLCWERHFLFSPDGVIQFARETKTEFANMGIMIQDRTQVDDFVTKNDKFFNLLTSSNYVLLEKVKTKIKISKIGPLARKLKYYLYRVTKNNSIKRTTI